MWWLIPILLVLFVLVHLAKMGRLYLVLMEYKISFGRFVLLYCKTTFMNLIIPFKIGELYRIYMVNKETKVWQVGVLGVLIDRFFDILALSLILLPIDLYFEKSVSAIAIVFGISLAVIMIGYFCILPTYTYLNKYIIMHKQSGRSMVILKGLEYVKQWYDFSTELIHGRFALITIASFLGWVFEVLLIKSFAGILSFYFGIHKSFGIRNFSDYVASIFFGGGSELTTKYTLGTAVVFLILSVMLQAAYYIRKERS